VGSGVGRTVGSGESDVGVAATPWDQPWGFALKIINRATMTIPLPPRMGRGLGTVGARRQKFPDRPHESDGGGGLDDIAASTRAIFLAVLRMFKIRQLLEFPASFPAKVTKSSADVALRTVQRFYLGVGRSTDRL